MTALRNKNGSIQLVRHDNFRKGFFNGNDNCNGRTEELIRTELIKAKMPITNFRFDVCGLKLFVG